MDLTVTLKPQTHRTALFGPKDKNLRLLRDVMGVQVVARNGSVKIGGPSEAAGKTANIIERMQQMLPERQQLQAEDVHEAMAQIELPERDNGEPSIDVYTRGTRILPRTQGQGEYLKAMSEHDMVFCLGPAGTGKTYLAVAKAVSALKSGLIKRIVLVRPAVEAGEKLGFLPGDLEAKVNPYLRPLFDAIHDMMNFDQLKRFMINDVIEVVPLAYMRGRTLNNAVIILDEAQNTTVSQMLMFLTRMGDHSKMIVTGDDSQVDLDKPHDSGLVDACRRLRHVDGISVVRLNQQDIVRHKLVQAVVEAYGGDGKQNKNTSEDHS